MLTSPGDPVGQGSEAAGAGDCSNGVEAPGVALAFDEDPGADEDRETDRQVDQQHPPPAQRASQQSAEQDPADDAQGRHGPIDGDGLVAQLARREGGGDQGQGVRCHQRCADALEGAGGDQELTRRGEPTGQ